MASTCIDTNTNCGPHVASLKARGVQVIARYYASSSWKRMTPPEARTLSDAGFRLVSVFEDSGKPPLTVEYGQHDAQIALNQAKAVGQPQGTPIYMALENLPSGYNASHLPGLKLYFQGVASVLSGQYAVGAYSNGLTLATLLDTGLIQYAWLSASMGFAGSKEFAMTNRWNLWQKLPIDLNWDGVSVDTNDTQGEFGAWALPARDNIDVAMRQMVQAPAEGAVTGAVAASITPQEKTPLLDRLSPNAAKIEELANQGSRIAEHIKSFKAMIWKAFGTFLTLIGLGSQVDTNKGTAQTVGEFGAGHPLLLALLCIGVTAAICLGYAYCKAKKVEKGLVSASNDGRYKPLGASA